MPIEFQVLLGVLTVVIAASGVFIAYQQWKLGEYKLKHDLFEKRWAVYITTHDMLVYSINGEQKAIRELYKEFKRKCMDAQFLFESDINDYMATLVEAIPELQGAYIKLTSNEMIPDSPERTALEKDIIEKTEWLRTQIKVLVHQFHPYLGLSR